MNQPMNKVQPWKGARQMGVVATVVSALIGAAQAGAAEAENLEEVVITAERRETNLQDTPLSIQALSAESMEQKGLADLGDVGMYMPNLMGRPREIGLTLQHNF